MIRVFITASLVLVAIVGLIATTSAYAAVDIYGACDGNSDSTLCSSQGDTVDNLAENIVNFLLMLVGMLSVVMIIVGGFKYVTSAGNSEKTKSAQNTVLYSVIGLLVAALAYAIIQFAYYFVS